LTFPEAAAFQWVNPNGWAMVLSVISVYTLNQSFLAAAVAEVVFGVPTCLVSAHGPYWANK